MTEREREREREREKDNDDDDDDDKNGFEICCVHVIWQFHVSRVSRLRHNSQSLNWSGYLGFQIDR